MHPFHRRRWKTGGLRSHFRLLCLISKEIHSYRNPWVLKHFKKKHRSKLISFWSHFLRTTETSLIAKRLGWWLNICSTDITVNFTKPDSAGLLACSSTARWRMISCFGKRSTHFGLRTKTQRIIRKQLLFCSIKSWQRSVILSKHYQRDSQNVFSNDSSGHIEKSLLRENQGRWGDNPQLWWAVPQAFVGIFCRVLSSVHGVHRLPSVEHGHQTSW